MVCRKDLNDHLPSNPGQHLALFCSALTATRAELDSVKGQLSGATAELDTLKTTVVDLERKLEEVSLRAQGEWVVVGAEQASATVETPESTPPKKTQRKGFLRRK